MDENHLVYVDLSLDARDRGGRANASGPVTDPDVIAAALIVQNYLTEQAARGAAPAREG